LGAGPARRARRQGAQKEGSAALSPRGRGKNKTHLGVEPRGLHVVDGHGDHGRLLLLGVDVLHQALAHQAAPRPRVLDERGARAVVAAAAAAAAALAAAALAARRRRRRVLDQVDRALQQAPHVPLAQAQALPVHDQQGPRRAPGVRVDAQLLGRKVVHDADLGVDVDLPPQRAERAHQLGGRAVDADPAAVDEDLRGLGDDRG
jgi:hypothetical protein